MDKLRCRLLTRDAIAPSRATEGSAGYDVHSQLFTLVSPGSTVVIPTGVILGIPQGWVGLLRGRSGLAFKHDISTFEGTIDSDYRGELAVRLTNNGTDIYTVHPGDRIAQLVIVPHLDVPVEVTTDLADTERGVAGFGSTGR